MSIEKAYDSWSTQYDSNKNKTRDLDRVATIESLKNHKFSFVVELGCGTGKNTKFLVSKAEKIISIDFSSHMLKIATEKIKSDKVSFRRLDITQEWGIKRDYADLITCSLTLEHIENLDQIFKQANQTLKENGLFFISELHPFKQYTGSKACYETPDGRVELEVFQHHISAFLKVAYDNSFELEELKEWFDEDTIVSDNLKIPRLISFVFKKN